MTDGTDKVNRLLAGLGQRIGVGGLALSSAGTCGFTLADRLQLAIELPEASAEFYLYSPMLPIPSIDAEPLFRRLLTMNLFCRETDGATFAISERLNSVVLCYGHGWADLDQTGFDNILENFIVTAERLQQTLAGPADASGETPRDSPPAGFLPAHFIPV